MKKVSIALLAAFVSSASIVPVYANEVGPHFAPPNSVSNWEGFGRINSNICNATAVVTTGPDTHVNPGPHVGHADYADVVFSNTGAPCNDYQVKARVHPNGNASNIEVKYLPTNTVVCANVGPYVGVVSYTLSGTNIINAALTAPITVGACTLDTDIDYVSGTSMNLVP